MTVAAAPATIGLGSAALSQRRPVSLIKQSYHSDAPWLFVALQKLKEVSNSKGHPDELVPAEATLMFARAAIAQSGRLDLPIPVVCPVSGGSIGMIWVVGKKQLEAVFYEDQIGSYVISDGDDIIEDGEILNVSANALARAFASLLHA